MSEINKNTSALASAATPTVPVIASSTTATTTTSSETNQQVAVPDAEAVVKINTVAATETGTGDEPLCLEYATPQSVPIYMRQLLAHEEHRKMSESELLYLLIYLVAMECGYTEELVYLAKRHLLKPVPATSSFHAHNLRILTQLAPEYSSDNIYRMALRTLVNGQSSEGSIVAATQSHLTGVVLGDLLMITLTPAPPSKERGYSVCLSIGRYVLNMQLKDKPVYHRFRKLDELSFQLREQLFQPLRIQQLTSMASHLQPSLCGLPSELYIEILGYLNKNQQNIVANVNRQLNSYVEETRRRHKIENTINTATTTTATTSSIATPSTSRGTVEVQMLRGTGSSRRSVTTGSTSTTSTSTNASNASRNSNRSRSSNNTENRGVFYDDYFT